VLGGSPASCYRVSQSRRAGGGVLARRQPADYTWGMVEIADVSLPSRVAEPEEGIGFDELGLAARNHGMPLELMRHDVTPLGAHYLLTHYDIPAADAATWQLEIAGLVARPRTWTMAALRARPQVTRAR